MSIIHLFPTPVYKFALAGHATYKKRLVKLLEQKFLSKSNKSAEWARCCNSWQIQAYDLDIQLQDMYEEIMKDVMKYIQYLQVNRPSYYTIFDSWFNVHTFDMYQEEHGHMPAFLSGIYYLQFDKEKDNSVYFLSPDKTFLYSSWAQGLPIINPELRTRTQLEDVNEGDVILFPSSLHHMVVKSKPHDQLRITNSFNIAPATSVHPTQDA